MTSREQFEEQLREALAEAVDCVQLRMDDPQSWPAILTYADTIESDDPDEAERLRHLVLCYKNGVEVPNFGLVETLMKSLDEPVAAPARKLTPAACEGRAGRSSTPPGWRAA